MKNKISLFGVIVLKMILVCTMIGCSTVPDKDIFTITFESNGGSEVSPLKFASGESFNVILPPTKNNFVFTGWHRNESLTDLWLHGVDTVTEDITLYARWMPWQPDPAKGAILTYLHHAGSTITNDELDRLTHIALFSLVPGPGGTVPMRTSTNPDSWANQLEDTIKRARERDVRVIIALGGQIGTGTFPESVKPDTRQAFVNHIVDFVNKHELDGVDIDWEYPGYNIQNGVNRGLSIAELYQEVQDFEAFMVLLKQGLGERRLSFAIAMRFTPGNTWNLNYTQATFDALDSLHVMTYDRSVYDHHADMEATKATIDAWLNSERINIDRSKILFGVPFYGRREITGLGSARSYSELISSNPAFYSQTNNVMFQGNRYWYDGIPQVVEKTEFAWDRGIGGIMIWQVKQDMPATSPYSLLNAIHTRTQELKAQQ